MTIRPAFALTVALAVIVLLVLWLNTTRIERMVGVGYLTSLCQNVPGLSVLCTGDDTIANYEFVPLEDGLTAQQVAWLRDLFDGPDGMPLHDNDFEACIEETHARANLCKFEFINMVGRATIEDGAMLFHKTVEDARSRGHHHTEITPMVQGFVQDRFAPYGVPLRYRFRYYSVDPVDDTLWEIPVQWHGMRDPLEASRNPPVALYIQDGRYRLVIRSDSRIIARDNNFDREESIDVGPVAANDWTTWELNVVWSWKDSGALVLKRDGEVVYEEYGKANAFRDLLGPVVTMGIYKNLLKGNTEERRAFVDDIQIFLQ